MVWKRILGVVLFLLLIFLFISYMFLPLESLSFDFKASNSNFSLNNETVEMQFYQNMRFPEPIIKYNIEDECTLNKKKDAKEAFEILSNLTDLIFIEDEEPEINVFCEDRNKIESGLFIAGEGGPTKIIQSNNFNIILKGEILLIRKSNCERPNVAIHEILHVLGFNHSENSKNIMYPISKCSQTIGEDMISRINYLYSFPSLSDLEIREASATLKGRYLDLNITLANRGFKTSKISKIRVLLDEKEIKSFEVEEIEIGSGQKIGFTNIWVSKVKVKEIKLILENNESELSKENNEIVLKIMR